MRPFARTSFGIASRASPVNSGCKVLLGRNWLRWQVVGVESARELSENYTLTGQSELPPRRFFPRRGPGPQNHSNLKGTTGYHRDKRTGTKQFHRLSLAWPFYRRNGLAHPAERNYEKSRVHHAPRPFVVIAKFLAGNLRSSCLSPLELFAWNISGKHTGEILLYRRDCRGIIFLLFRWIGTEHRENERKRERERERRSCAFFEAVGSGVM